jgi:formylglycine-generating enzyme required for sulfatase activity
MKSHRLSSKRSVIWRGDLVRTRLFQSAYSDNRPDVLPLIDSLGFTAELPAEPPETSRLRMEKFRQDLVEFNRLKKVPPSNELGQPPVKPTHCWTPTQYQSPPWKARSQDPETEDLSKTENPNGVPVVRVPFRPLATWPQLRNRLQPMLSRTVVTRKVDAKKLVAMLCRCESIAKLPRVERKRSPEQVHVIADRSDRCIPFFSDQQLVAEQIGRELARDQCRFSVGRLPHVLDKSNTTLRTQFRRGWTESEEDLRNEEPDPQSTVLILGDLAVLERHKPQERASWVHCCSRWRQRGVKIYALVPYATDQLPREFIELVEPIAWQGNGVEYASNQRREDFLRAIFVRSYPAMQLEPALLRELRTMVPDAMDASLESDIWQHDWLASNHVGGARNDRVDVKERLHDEFERLEDETRRWVLSIQRRFRQSAGYGSLWQLEFLNQTLRTRKLLKEYKQDTEAMSRTLKEYEAYVLRDAIPDDKHDQIAWYSRRVSEAALDDDLVGNSVRRLQRTFQESQGLHRATRIGEIRSDGIPRSVGLTGRFDKIEARVIRGGSEVASAGSDRVTMRSTSPVIEIQVPELDAVARRERDFWKSGVKPQWVSDYGTDAYGAWCEFQVPRHDGKGMVTQRMRWIKPGKFMMGSPESKEGRLDYESPAHSVKLTQGYWMADSQVTQELWMAVGRGENPSSFKGESNPVENVSWKDCQSWLEKLCEHHETPQLSLPTEAQWEYACRAGSTSAYCFGDDPKELTKYGWFGKNAEGKTRPVKQLQPNGWGLCDMHGNVWEWCSDWYGDYAASAQSDPTGPTKGTSRVFRGGSWDFPARYLRSACRLGNAPGMRGDGLGFRLLSSALGAEPSERAMLPVAEQGTERARPVQVRVKDQETSRTDRFWKSGIKPQWVSDYGKDDYGLWCEFQVPNYWSDTKSKNKDRVGNEPHGFVTQRMRWIKPGVFLMGSDQSTKELWYGDETQHEVTLTQGFWMADTPCTQVLWIGVGTGKNPSFFEGSRNPVERVSWEGCQEWLKGLGEIYPQMRPSLPTEAQWEYACRAGSTGVYCFGDSEEELEKYAWYWENSGGTTHPVGEKLPNAWGLYDMHGNIWEWCLDWYAEYTKTSVTDPMGASRGRSRVLRGGSWSIPARDLRSACRVWFSMGLRDGDLGFRIVSSALGAEPSEEAMLPVAEQGTERARIGSAEPAYEFLRSVDLDATGDRTPEQEFSELDVTAYASIRVVSDQEGYQFDRLEKPSWAVDFGSDRYGLFATFEVKPVRQRMRWIPPGKFVMGSPAERDYGRGDEGPQHEVIITHGYWMFDTPCTQGLWTALMGDNPSSFPDPERPVEQVSWEDAVRFSKKLNERLVGNQPLTNKRLVDGWERLLFRLPTEAEWEYAGRAGTTGDTYAGDLDLKSRDQTKAELLDSIAWYGGNSGHAYDLEKSVEMSWLKDLQAEEKRGGTRKVAQKTPNPWGLYDMLGNVWEWCQNWYGEYPVDPVERVVNPTRPTEGTERVMRGGSWYNRARDLRSACRRRLFPGDLRSFLGFRLLSSAHQATESGEEASQSEEARGGRGTRPRGSDE